MILKTQTTKKTISHCLLSLLLAGLSLAWFDLAPAYAAAPPICYPNTSLGDLRLENSPLSDHAFGDVQLDFDGDGKTDVFSTEPDGNLHRWRFSSEGRRPWQPLSRSSVNPADLRFGHFNDDGKTDVFLIINGFWTYFDGGLGAAKVLFFDTNQFPLTKLRFGDFDGDRITDVFIENREDKRWYYSPGANDEFLLLNTRQMGTPLSELRFGDFNGNGTTDVFRRLANGRWQYSEGGTTDWQDLARSITPDLADLRFGDFDGDGKTDAFRRKADGQWQYSPGAAADWQDLGRSEDVLLAGLRFGDFDGDGKTDVFNQVPGGKWRVALGGVTPWRIIFATVEVNGGLLTCLTGASEADRDSGNPAISADGRKIVFRSDSDFKGEGNIAPFQFEIWLYDGDRGRLNRITTASGPDRSSSSPAISADGSKVVFSSSADFNGIKGRGEQEIWLYDAIDGDLTRVSTASGPDRGSFDPAISADGRKVVFRSDSDFIGEGIPDNQFEIWLYDADRGGLITRVTIATGPNRGSFEPDISADGSKIVFSSNTDFNGEGNRAGEQVEIWLYDQNAQPGQEFTRVTTAGPDRASFAPAISADGTKIAFTSSADFNGEGIPANQFEIWLYDVPGSNLSRVTNSGPGRSSVTPAISADGSKIVFVSNADFNGEGIPANLAEIWLYDGAAAGQFSRVTTTSGSGGGDTENPAISADGNKIVFESDADLLELGPPPGQIEIWLFEAGQAAESNPSGDFRVFLPLITK